jgi:hypothetical protein
MPKTPHSLQAIVEHTGKAITSIAREADIDPASLAKIGRGVGLLTTVMLEKLVAQDFIPDRDKQQLVQSFIEDRLPENARSLVLIAKRSLDGESVIREEEDADDFDRAIKRLSDMGKNNPALARAIRNMVAVYEGKFDVQP